MPTAITAYLSTLVPFLVLEGGWLSVMGPLLYKPEIGALLTDKPRGGPAALFYLLYVGGVTWLIVLPQAEVGWASAFVRGAVLGLIAYGTYDLTCAATMRTWSTRVTLADMAWGALATGAACAAGALVTARFRA